MTSWPVCQLHSLAFYSFQIFLVLFKKSYSFESFHENNLCTEADELFVILFVFIVKGHRFIWQLSFVCSYRLVYRINLVHSADGTHARSRAHTHAALAACGNSCRPTMCNVFSNTCLCLCVVRDVKWERKTVESPVIPCVITVFVLQAGCFFYI